MSVEPIEKATPQRRFPWAYVVLPLSILALSLIAGAIFFGRLPQEVAYRFSGAVIHTTVSQGAFIALTVTLQLVFAVISVVIALVVTAAIRRLSFLETRVNRTAFFLMSNMPALPMIIVFYGMLGVFTYNIYGTELPALWLFALVVLIISAIVMAVFFTRAFILSRRMKNGVHAGRITDARD